MVYDALLVIAILMVFSVIVVIPFGGGVEPATLWFQAYLLVVWWAYFAICWRWGGQTVGMRAWRVRLVTESNGRIGWTGTVLRFVVAWLSAAAAGLGFLWSLFDSRRRTWHDLATATYLVVEPRRNPRGG
ncbi:MAG: RDD family protein [Gammaproteobacteria bacterium]|jgi:uncharacterized RDD family membrane protein YckC|nr:RDD family protein [Gammaproteobacteria bacterium]